MKTEKKKLSRYRRWRLTQQLRRASIRAQRDLKLIDKWMQALGYDRARRRQYWREFHKDQTIQNTFFSIINYRTLKQK